MPANPQPGSLNVHIRQPKTAAETATKPAASSASFDRYDEAGRKWRRELHKRSSDGGFRIPPLSKLPAKSG